jgi:hypothetical protein
MEGNTMHAILAPPKQMPGGKKAEARPQPAPPQQQAAPAGGAKTGS